VSRYTDPLADGIPCRHDPLTPTEADEHGYWRAELRDDEADLRREHRDE